MQGTFQGMSESDSQLWSNHNREVVQRELVDKTWSKHKWVESLHHVAIESATDQREQLSFRNLDHNHFLTRFPFQKLICTMSYSQRRYFRERIEVSEKKIEMKEVETQERNARKSKERNARERERER